MEALANPGLESTLSGANRWLLRILPSLTDFAFAVPVLWLFFVMTGSITLLSDGDTGWHIRTGEWIWQHHVVPATDLFSFTRPHGAWYAWEWLWDLLFAGIHHFGGLGAVAFVNVCVLCLVSVVLFRLIRRTTDSDLLSLACTLVTMAASSIHWLARPHIISWLFVLAFAHALLTARRGDFRVLCWLPLAMLFWTNLHGSFFIGIIMLLLAASGEVIGAFLHAQNFWDAAFYRSRYYLATALACSLVTFINPYGWQLHAHVAHYISDNRLLSHIGEFKSMDFHNPVGTFFEIVLLIALPSALWAGRRQQYSTVLELLAFAHLALYSARNIPIFVLLAALPAASLLQELLRLSQSSPRLRKLASALSQADAHLRPFERSRRLYVCSAVTMLFLAAAFAAGIPRFEGRFNRVTFPTNALAFVRQARFSRLFTTDTWASYFVYNLYPQQRSFLDGRSDYFGSDFLDEYAHVIEARWDWEKNLDRYSVDGVVLRPDVPVASALKASNNWRLLFDDGSVLVFAHKRRGAMAAARTSITQVSPVQASGRKKLGLPEPGLIVSSNTKSQERRS